MQSGAHLGPRRESASPLGSELGQRVCRCCGATSLYMLPHAPTKFLAGMGCGWVGATPLQAAGPAFTGHRRMRRAEGHGRVVTLKTSWEQTQTGEPRAGLTLPSSLSLDPPTFPPSPALCHWADWGSYSLAEESGWPSLVEILGPQKNQWVQKKWGGLRESSRAGGSGNVVGKGAPPLRGLPKPSYSGGLTPTSLAR